MIILNQNDIKKCSNYLSLILKNVEISLDNFITRNLIQVKEYVGGVAITNHDVNELEEFLTIFDSNISLILDIEILINGVNYKLCDIELYNYRNEISIKIINSRHEVIKSNLIKYLLLKNINND